VLKLRVTAILKFLWPKKPLFNIFSKPFCRQSAFNLPNVLVTNQIWVIHDSLQTHQHEIIQLILVRNHMRSVSLCQIWLGVFTFANKARLFNYHSCVNALGVSQYFSSLRKQIYSLSAWSVFCIPMRSEDTIIYHHLHHARASLNALFINPKLCYSRIQPKLRDNYATASARISNQPLHEFARIYFPSTW
jgi:hypothetical protein